MVAPVFDAATGATSAGGTGISYTHPPVGSTNLWVTICVFRRGGAFTPTVGTYGGANFLGNLVSADDSGPGDCTLNVYHLPGPSTGAQTVAFTLAAADDYGSIAKTYTGAHQTTPLLNNNSATGNSTAPTVAVTSTTGNRIVGFVTDERENTAAQMSPNSGQTERISQDTEGGDRGRTEGGDDTSDATSTTYAWTFTNADAWVIAAMEIDEPAAAGGLPVPVAFDHLAMLHH